MADARDMLAADSFHEKLDLLEQAVRRHPESFCDQDTEKLLPVDHNFVEGHYIRTMRSPAGILAVTKTHRLAHPFMITDGEAIIFDESGKHYVKAPFVGVTKAGARRVVYTMTPVEWVTIHQIAETNVGDAEAAIFEEDWERKLIEETQP